MNIENRELLVNRIINNSELIIPVKDNDNFLHIKFDYMTKEDFLASDNIEIHSGGAEL